MDSYYEYAGASAATMLHDVLSNLGLPMILAAAGVAWKFFRVAEDGVARPLATYFLSLMLLVWLLRPVEIAEGVRTPRFVQLLGASSDLVVRTSVRKINADFLTRPFEYERVAALAGQAHVQDPEVRKTLTVFLSSCTQNAMATARPVSQRAYDNPIAPDSGLPYEQFHLGSSGAPCEQVRRQLWDDLQRELDRFAIHRAVLDSVGPGGRDAYLGTIVRNEWSGRVDFGGEMALVRRSVGSMEGITEQESTLTVEQFKADGVVASAVVSAVVPIAQALITAFAKTGQGWGDTVTSRQRYYLITAHAPYVYGLILMILTAFFPVAGLWALLPDKWTVLVNYGKVFLSVKLWPIGWALVSAFSAHRPPMDALTDDAKPGDATVAVSLLYFMIPALCFLVMHLAATAAAAPFREGMPGVVGASNGPVGGVVMAAVRRAAP